MKVVKTALDNTGFFSDLFLDYLSEKPELQNFYEYFPEEKNFSKKAEALNFSSEKRNVLYTSLLNQYKGFELPKEVKENLEFLKKENTYTITTGHQLNLFSGPLYFIYKIITVINAARKLNEANKERHFIPVYWMATEDHDFEEINHFFLFNKKFTWETNQTGPVGRFASDAVKKVLEDIKEALPLFEKAYLQHKNLAAATRYFVNELFGKEGLLILDGDDKELKRQFKAVIVDELFHHTSSVKITEASGRLEMLGYKLQIHPREINLFYMETGLRSRIVREGENFKVLDTDLQFSEKDIRALVETNPEKFSPNVALRPVYQQIILPNVAYCGGPAELAYWLQLKSLCDYYQASFPLLMPRNFVLFVNQANHKKLHKINIDPKDLFLPDHKLKEKILQAFSGEEYKIEEEVQSMENVFVSLKNKASKIDPTLEGFVGAEKQKAIRIMEGIEKRLKKAEEGKNEGVISQVLNLKARLFPEGHLQERRDNFLNFYMNDAGFIQKIKLALDPFDYQFQIVIEDV